MGRDHSHDHTAAHVAGFRLTLAAYCGPAAIVAATIAMLVWSWGTWPDVLVDFGRELYVPWRIVSGETLYTDIAYFNGPLSAYFHALLFLIFGVSLRTLVIANILLALLLTWLLYRVLRAIAGALGAAVGCLTFVLLFAYAQVDRTGSYNYVCPYSYEMTHGLLLSMAAIQCVLIFQRRHTAWVATCAGLLVGAVFLTKAEVFLAAFTATSIGVFASILLYERGWTRRARLMGAYLGGLLCFPLGAFLFLAASMPLDKALVGALGPWVHVLNSELTSARYYRLITGRLYLDQNLRIMATWICYYALAAAPALGCAYLLRRRPRLAAYGAAVLAVIYAYVLYSRVSPVLWSYAFRPLPAATAAIVLVSGVTLIRRRRDPQAAAPVVVCLTLAVFALVLLAKIALNTRVSHYGFVLSMPATVLLFVALTVWVPEAINRRGGCGLLFRGAAIGMGLAAAAAHLTVAGANIKTKDTRVGSGGDAFVTDSRGGPVNTVLNELQAKMAPGQTLAVLPEGVMLNYLLRRSNPTPYFNFMPPELIMFDERRMLAAFQADPPDFVALVHKDTAVFGVRFFGRDYGLKLSEWIVENYQLEGIAGDMPLNDEKFGIALLKHSGP